MINTGWIAADSPPQLWDDPLVVQEPPTYRMGPPAAGCDVQKRPGDAPVACRKLRKRRWNVPTGYWNGLGWPVFAGDPGNVGSKYPAGTFRQAIGTALQTVGTSIKASGTSRQAAGTSIKASGTSRQTVGTAQRSSGTAQAGGWIYLKKSPQIEKTPKPKDHQQPRGPPGQVVGYRQLVSFILKHLHYKVSHYDYF